MFTLRGPDHRILLHTCLGQPIHDTAISQVTATGRSLLEEQRGRGVGHIGEVHVGQPLVQQTKGRRTGYCRKLFFSILSRGRGSPQSNTPLHHPLLQQRHVMHTYACTTGKTHGHSCMRLVAHRLTIKAEPQQWSPTTQTAPCKTMLVFPAKRLGHSAYRCGLQRPQRFELMTFQCLVA